MKLFRKRKVDKFMNDNDWHKCRCGKTHYYNGTHLEGKPLSIKDLYNIGIGLVKPCTEVLNLTQKDLNQAADLWSKGPIEGYKSSFDIVTLDRAADIELEMNRSKE